MSSFSVPGYFKGGCGEIKQFIKERYREAIEEIITINELKTWMRELSGQAVDELLQDINRYYRLELNLP
jgi:hypothetical protein